MNLSIKEVHIKMNKIEIELNPLKMTPTQKPRLKSL